ncbi:MAG TPA: thioredoxin [Armatimonadota bacterium]|jgi:thioredoxin 1
MSAALEVNEANFKQEVLDSSIPVLVDFWAPWCGPCRMVGPVVDEIAKDYAGKLKVVKVNTDEAPGVAGSYNIMSIPTLMIFKGGERVDQIIGAQPKQAIVGKLSPHM